MKALSLILALFSFGYLAPWTISVWRGKKDTLSIFCLNFFLGWTVIGWVISLVWATKHD